MLLTCFIESQQFTEKEKAVSYFLCINKADVFSESVHQFFGVYTETALMQMLKDIALWVFISLRSPWSLECGVALHSMYVYSGPCTWIACHS